MEEIIYLITYFRYICIPDIFMFKQNINKIFVYDNGDFF